MNMTPFALTEIPALKSPKIMAWIEAFLEKYTPKPFGLSSALTGPCHTASLYHWSTNSVAGYSLNNVFMRSIGTPSSSKK